MKTRNFFAFLLALVLCFSLTATTFASKKVENVNKTETIETTDNIAPRAGGGSAARFISGEGSFTFPVGGSGMTRIRVEVSGTTSNNYTVGTVTAPNGTAWGFNIIGNDTDSHTFSYLPAGTYSVYVVTKDAASVVAVYVE